MFRAANYDRSKLSELKFSVRMAWDSVQQAVRC